MRKVKLLLRQQILAKRRLISERQKIHFSNQISKTLFQKDYYKSAQRIAFYYSMPDEVFTLNMIAHALKNQKSVYLPVLATPKLQFAKILNLNSLHKNRFGIYEPLKSAPFINPKTLDLVIVPLVAFDHECNRLGMGAGFYDSTFGFRTHCSKPKLVGVAFEQQRVRQIPHGKLDLKLDEIITDRGCYSPRA